MIPFEVLPTALNYISEPAPWNEKKTGYVPVLFKKFSHPTDDYYRMQRVEKVLERVTELPFSPVAAKILKLARDERVGARDIANVITQDQAFTARLLRIANSPYYGQARAVTTVTQAVPVLGVNTITSLALALFAFGSFDDDDNAILTMRELWEHSIGCAIWGRQIAKRAGHIASEETFIAGLLHDMGKALFYRHFKNEFLEAVSEAQTKEISLLEAEQSILGTDHARAGAAVARKWNLPPVLVHAIEFHHEPLSMSEDIEGFLRKTVAIVHVADSLSDAFQIGWGVENSAGTIDEEVWRRIGANLESCNELHDQVLAEVNEFRAIFDISSGTKKPTVRTQSQGNGRRAEPAAKAVAKPGNGLQQPAVNQPIDPMITSFARFMDAGKQLALLAGLDDLLPNIASQAMALLNADAAQVLVPKGNCLEVTAAAGLRDFNNKLIPTEGSLVGWVVSMGEMMAVTSLDKAPASWEKNHLTALGYRSHLLLPVTWAGKKLAVLCVHSRNERNWTSQEVSLINTFVGLVAVALENASLYREAEEKAKTLEALNKQLKEALHVKTRFLATVSHELRSPLLVITGYASLIADQSFGPLSPGVAEVLAKIIKQADVLITLISYILEISQIDGGTFTLQPRPFDLKQLLDEVSQGMPDLIGKKPIVFETKYDRAFPPLVTDRTRLKEILRQVLDNAVKFTQKGKIVLGASATKEHVEIVVQDTGIGIDPENHKIIFDSFRQVDQEDNRRFEGLGLGLYLSQRLAELLGGRINVESKPGEGSCFRVCLPREVCPSSEGSPI